MEEPTCCCSEDKHSPQKEKPVTLFYGETAEEPRRKRWGPSGGVILFNSLEGQSVTGTQLAPPPPPGATDKSLDYSSHPVGRYLSQHLLGVFSFLF